VRDEVLPVLTKLVHVPPVPGAVVAS